jgi:hypothetical protein
MRRWLSWRSGRRRRLVKAQRGRAGHDRSWSGGAWAKRRSQAGPALAAVCQAASGPDEVRRSSFVELWKVGDPARRGEFRPGDPGVDGFGGPHKDWHGWPCRGVDCPGPAVRACRRLSGSGGAGLVSGGQGVMSRVGASLFWDRRGGLGVVAAGLDAFADWHGAVRHGGRGQTRRVWAWSGPS